MTTYSSLAFRRAALAAVLILLGGCASFSPDGGFDAVSTAVRDRAGAEPRWAERREADTRAALARGVFGAPSYVIGDDIFWGQDRLEFVEKRLARGSA